MILHYLYYADGILKARNNELQQIKFNEWLKGDLTMKTIGIIGGMGPMATVDLMQKIIQATDAHEDQE